MGMAYEVFKIDLHIITVKHAAVLATIPDDPFPIETLCHETVLLVPRERRNPVELVHGQRNVPTIANNVDNQRVRKGFLNRGDVEQMSRRSVCPAVHVLLARNFFHHDSKKIPSAVALLNDLLFYMIGD